MSSLAKSMYRLLLRRAKTMDNHQPLKLLMPSLNSPSNTLLQYAFKFHGSSHSYQESLYDSSFSLKQHVRITYDFLHFIHSNPTHEHVSDLSSNYWNETYLVQVAFDIIKTLSTAFQLAEFIEYDPKYIESLPRNSLIPVRLSDVIQQQLADADEETTNSINEACTFIKLGNTCAKIEDRISYYIKSINAYETADGFTYLGWMIYRLSVLQEAANDKDNKNTKMGPLSDVMDAEMTKTFKEEILEYLGNEDYVSQLNTKDGMLLCMKCDRIASSLDPSFGNCWNDMGVIIMNQLYISDQSDKALELFDTAKLCYRYSSREFPFVNAARLYLRHRKDIVRAIKEYLGALHFNRHDAEAIGAIQDYRNTLINAMKRKKFRAS
eukprot:26676_1